MRKHQTSFVSITFNGVFGFTKNLAIEQKTKCYYDLHDFTYQRIHYMNIFIKFVFIEAQEHALN